MWPWANARNKATLLAQLICLTDWVEGNRVVEVRERNDQQEENADVQHVLAVDHVVVNKAGNRTAPTFGASQHVGAKNWKQQHGAGKNDRHDSGLVYLQRNISVLSAVHFAANNTFCELHGNAALAQLHANNGNENADGDGHENNEHHNFLALQQRVVAVWQTADHRSKNQHRHAVTNATLANQFANPHQQCSACNKRRNNQECAWHKRIEQDHVGRVACCSEECGTPALPEDKGEAGALQRGNSDC